MASCSTWKPTRTSSRTCGRPRERSHRGRSCSSRASTRPLLSTTRDQPGSDGSVSRPRIDDWKLMLAFELATAVQTNIIDTPTTPLAAGYEQKQICAVAPETPLPMEVSLCVLSPMRRYP